MYDDKSVETNSIKERIKLSEHTDTSYPTWVLILVFVIVFVVSLVLSKIFTNEIMIACSISLSFINSASFISLVQKNGISLFDKIFNAKVTYVSQKLFSPEQFYDTVNEILSKVEEKNIIILIDNIDRCSVDEFKDTISSIKGFFNDDGKIVYLIPFDIEQFSIAYNKEYQSYSEKVFDYSIDLKEKSQKNVIEFVDKLLVDESEYFSLFTNDAIDVIAKSDCKTPRQIINICNDYITEYNLFVMKNTLNSNYITKEDLSYLMKYTILKKYHKDLFSRTHMNIDIIKRLDFYAATRTQLNQAKKEYDWLTEKTYLFLRKTSDIKPINYAYFYSSQSKDDFEIDNDTLSAIQSQEYEKIGEMMTVDSKKEQILKYLNKSIMYEKNKGLWKLSISPKVRLIIYLLKNELLLLDEVDKFFDFLIRDSDFFRELILTREIDIDDSIDFINKISEKYNKKYQLKNKLLDGLTSGLINTNEENKMEIISKIFAYMKLDKLNNEQQNYFIVHIDNLINNNKYKLSPHVEIFKSDLKKYITSNQVKQLLDNTSANDNTVFIHIIELVKNLPADDIDNELINKFISFINRVYLNADCDEFFIDIFTIIDEKRDEEKWKNYIGNLNINSISEEHLDFQLCDLLFTIFKYLGYQNIKNLILSINTKEHKKYIYNKIMSEKELNEYLILLAKDMISRMSGNEFNENIPNTALMYKKVTIENKSWLNQYINANYPDSLEQFYNELLTHEDKENLAEYIVNLPLMFEQKLYKVKFFMTSNDRFNKLISEQNDLIKLESVINKTDNHYRNLTVNKISNVIDGKSSIVNDDLESVIRILNNNQLSLQNKKQILISLGVNKNNPSDLKRIYDVLEYSATIKREYGTIRAVLSEYGLIENKVVQKEENIDIKLN